MYWGDCALAESTTPMRRDSSTEDSMLYVSAIGAFDPGTETGDIFESKVRALANATERLPDYP